MKSVYHKENVLIQVLSAYWNDLWRAAEWWNGYDHLDSNTSSTWILWEAYGIWWKSLTRSGWVFLKISLWEKHFGNRIVSGLWLCHQAFNWVHVWSSWYAGGGNQSFLHDHLYIHNCLWFKNNKLVGKVWLIMEPWLAVLWIIKEPVLTWNHSSPKTK